MDVGVPPASAEFPEPEVEEGAGRYELTDAEGIAPGADTLADPGPDAAGPSGPTAGGVTPPGVRAHAPPEVPGYEVFGELGRGGMGVVYRAREVRLNRPVALKMILAGPHAGPEAVARFLAEAKAAAQLQHPNIVQIHAIGDHDGRPFLALEYVDGGSLADGLDGTPRPPREAAKLVETLARAIHEAHARGIVHRDLKPSNILMTAGGVPKVADFGLAKSLEADSGLTRPDSIVGTPSYMAPEQAGAGGAVGPAADVHALGAILYELMTGRTPFKAATVLETLAQVKSAEPVPPSRLLPGLPRDPETICLECLHKEPARRYASALALAEDLRRYRDGEPILARPVGRAGRAWRWCRRNPATAALTAAVAGLLVAVAVVSTVAAVRLARAARAAELHLADLRVSFGLVAGERGDPGQAALWFANAARTAHDDPERVRLDLVRARSWDSHVPFEPTRALPHDEPWLRGLAYHPGGRHLLTAAPAGRVALWDLDREAPIPPPGGPRPAAAAAWSPDGRWLALGRPEGGVEVFAFPGGTPIRRFPHRGPAGALAFSPDGHYLAVAGRVLRVWDCRARDFATPGFEHPGPIRGLAFSARGDLLATGCADQQARAFRVPGDPAAPGPIYPPVPHVWSWAEDDPRSARPIAPTFALGGRLLLTLAGPAEVSVRDAATGAPVGRVAGPEYTALAASPDGRHFALGWYQGAALHDAATGRRIGPDMPHRNSVAALAFRPDGRALLTGCVDNTARAWAVPDALPLGPPIPHQRPVSLVAYAPDGRSAATAQHGGLVRTWAPPREVPRADRLAAGGWNARARLGRDGRLFIPAGLTFRQSNVTETRAYDAATLRPAGPGLRPGGLILDAAIAPDARRAATLSSPAATEDDRARPRPATTGAGWVHFWDLRTGRSLGTPLATPSEPRSLDFSPDGRRAAVLCAGGEILVIDPDSGRPVARWSTGGVWKEPGDFATNGTIRHSPDGRALLAWGAGPGLRAWDAEAGTPRYTLLADQFVHDAAFSADGLLLATAAWDRTARVWDLATGRPAAGALAHPEWVFSARFSPDGRTLLTTCRDGLARLWDWRSGRLALPPLRHDDEVFAAAFAPDGRSLATTGLDRTLRVWGVRAGKPLCPPIPLDGGGLDLALTPDGTAIVGGFGPSLRVARLGDLSAPTDLDPDDARTWAELISGRRLDETGEATTLSAAEWLDRWRSFRARHPDSEVPDADSSP